MDILGKVPNVIIRYGLFIFLIILIGILSGLYFISYPETFQSSVVIYEKDILADSVPDISFPTQYIGHTQMTVNNINKIELKSSVKIALHQYPRNQYGLLSGTVFKVKKNNNLQVYDVYIIFPQGLNTSFHKTINYLPNDMLGEVYIYGSNRSLIERLFDSPLSD